MQLRSEENAKKAQTKPNHYQGIINIIMEKPAKCKTMHCNWKNYKLIMFNVRHLILVISFPHFPRCNHHHCSNGEANGVIPSRIVDLLHINEIAFHRKR